MLYRLSSMSWMNLIHGVQAPALQALREAGDEPDVQSGAHLSSRGSRSTWAI
jgi:hypothetical protein